MATPSPTSFMNGPLMEMYTYLIQFTLSALVKLSNLNFSFIISARQFVALSLKLKINKLLFLNWGILKNVVHYTYRFLIVSTSDKHFKLSLNNLRTRFSNSDLKLHFIYSIWTKCEKKFPTGLEIWISKLEFNNRTCIICIELKWMFEPIVILLGSQVRTPPGTDRHVEFHFRFFFSEISIKVVCALKFLGRPNFF